MDILRQAIEFPDNTSVSTVWARSLNTGNSAYEIYGGLTKLVWLIQEVKNELSNLPAKLNAPWADELAIYVIQTNLSETWVKEKGKFQSVVRVANDTAAHYPASPTSN